MCVHNLIYILLYIIYLYVYIYTYIICAYLFLSFFKIFLFLFPLMTVLPTNCISFHYVQAQPPVPIGSSAGFFCIENVLFADTRSDSRRASSAAYTDPILASPPKTPTPVIKKTTNETTLPTVSSEVSRGHLDGGAEALPRFGVCTTTIGVRSKSAANLCWHSCAPIRWRHTSRFCSIGLGTGSKRRARRRRHRLKQNRWDGNKVGRRAFQTARAILVLPPGQLWARDGLHGRAADVDRVRVSTHVPFHHAGSKAEPSEMPDLRDFLRRICNTIDFFEWLSSAVQSLQVLQELFHAIALWRARR